MVTLSENNKPGELLKKLFAAEYNLESTTLTNSDPNTTPPARDIADVVGLPVKGATAGAREIAYATEEGDVTGIVVEGPSIADLDDDGETVDKYSVLIRGPAVIHQSVIQTADPAGDDYTVATIVSTLAALSPPIIVVTGPATVSEQTT